MLHFPFQTLCHLTRSQYQELFAICQALPGPASTKMCFCIALIHAGIIPAIFVFLVWSLPGALGMYGLSLGVQNMPDKLPPIVYALLSGLNASTVGIIALAAVQLAEKAITDKLTRILVLLGACAGLCYNALWYFPVLIVIGGVVTVIWDTWLRQKIGKLRAKWRRRRENPEASAEENVQMESIPIDEEHRKSSDGVQRRAGAASGSISKDRISIEELNNRRGENGGHRVAGTETMESTSAPEPAPVADTTTHGIPVKVGLTIIACFFRKSPYTTFHSVPLT